MIPTLQSIESEVLRLPEDQRITLAHRILMSTEPFPNASIDSDWEMEIERRIVALDQGKTNRHSASDVFEESDRRLIE